MKIFSKLLLCVCVLLIVPQETYSQANNNKSTFKSDSLLISQLTEFSKSNGLNLPFASLDSTYFLKIEAFNFKDASIKDLLRAIAREYNVNIIVQESVSGSITIRLNNLTVIEAILHICIDAKLTPELRGSVLTIKKNIEIIPTRNQIIVVNGNTINIDIDQLPIDDFIRKIVEQTPYQIIKQQGLDAKLSGLLLEIETIKALKLIAESNGLTVRKNNDVYYIERSFQSLSNAEGLGKSGWVQVSKDSLVSLEVSKVPILDIVYELAKQLNLNLITYVSPTGALNAKFKDVYYLEALSLILRGSGFTFRSENGIIIIGNKQTTGISNNRLIKLKHLRADNVLTQIPEIIRKDAFIQVIKEQNAIMVIGTPETISDVIRYVNEMDLPTPQILMEVLVVDVHENNLFELGATIASTSKSIDTARIPGLGIFGQLGATGRPTGGLTLQGTGADINRIFGSNGNLLGIRNLGQLPTDFYVRIQALSQEGKIEIKSRPQIATLNGHEASIEIGTTQYYILTSTTPLQSSNQIITQESQRFEKIEANISLKITPYVNASGEVTTEIHPEFNTPVGELNPDIPPTINKRVLDSTVRLKDGETIILGGLIQESISRTTNKIPFLGDIPLLGRLFTNTFTDKGKSELIIFITPYVFYGDENDNLKWNAIRNKLNIEKNNDK